jgi:type III restriction enzyme
LRGLAEYAEKHEVFYRRIESISEVDGKLRLLDLTNDAVRQAILISNDAKALFRSEYAEVYLD